MSSVECLRQFVNERLTAASEEIFVVFRKTVVELEEEIDRQRRLLDIVLKPDVKLHWTELPLQHVCLEEEEEEEEEEGLCVQVRISSLDPEEPEPPHIEEEQGELCSSQEGEQLGLNQETDAFLLTPTNEEIDPSEDQTMDLNAGNTLREPGKQAVFKMPVISCVVSVAKMNPLLLANNSDLAESQDHKGGKHGDSALTRRTQPEWKKRHRKRASQNAHTGQKSLTCDTCGKEFRCQSQFKRHLITHTGGKLGKFSCKTCGKGFSKNSQLTAHSRTHTGEKPLYLSCKTCGKDFRFDSDLKRHMTSHTGDKPYACETCGKAYGWKSLLTVHKRIHTGEKPLHHTCKTCGKDFRFDSDLKRHMVSHTGEKPYLCKTCGQRFTLKSALKSHMKVHTTDEGPVAPARRRPRRRTRLDRKCTLSST